MPPNSYPSLKPQEFLTNNPVDDVGRVDLDDLASYVPLAELLQWQEMAKFIMNQPEDVRKAPSAIRRTYRRVRDRMTALESTYRIYPIGQLITLAELVPLLKWMRECDGLGPPALVIQTHNMFPNAIVRSHALAAGMDGHFHLDLSAKSFQAEHYLLDELIAESPPHFNPFYGKRKRVFVERPIPGPPSPSDWEKRSFEFIGEFEVDIIRQNGKQYWNTPHLISQEMKKLILMHYQDNLMSPDTEYQVIGNHFQIGSEVRRYYEDGDFNPFVSLKLYPQSKCYFIAMPLYGGFPDLYLDSGLELESESESADNVSSLSVSFNG